MFHYYSWVFGGLQVWTLFSAVIFQLYSEISNKFSKIVVLLEELNGSIIDVYFFKEGFLT